MAELFDPDSKPAGPDHKPVAVAKREVLPAQSQQERLLEKVLESGNIEVLERYIALRKSEEERQARIRFEEEFSRMRSRLPTITKSKDVSIQGTKAYSYAPLEQLQRMCDPIIYEHGFSYSWREEAIPSDGGKRVYMDIFGYGHVRSNSFDVPQLPQITSRTGNAVTNLVQTAGMMTTYGQRYTFKAGFGLVIEGEDDDGRVADTASEDKLRPMLEDMANQQSPEALMRVYIQHFKSLANDKPGQSRLLAVKNDLIKRLQP